jgi:glycosyltransferase involved in cell wall biosynthesis
MNPTPIITVAICTHNRAAFVEKALASLMSQSAPASAFDILVVDNASSDGTSQLVERWSAKDARVRGVREERLGLSYARNRAIEEAKARYLAYLDDDAIAAPDWVQSLLDAFRNVQPNPVAVGGPVRPIWGGPPPSWLGDGMRGVLTIIDFGERGHVIQDLYREFIAGANMAFELTALREVGGFDVGLGRVGKRLLSGEEILLLRQLGQRGGSVYWEPRAIVQHYVPADRLNKDWFYRRYYWDGISQAIGDIRLNRLGIGRRIFQVLRSTKGYLLSGRYRGMLFGDETRRMGARLETLRYLSKMYGYLVLR